MDVYKTYADKMMDFLTQNIYFTAQDIMRITKTTAPHSVIRNLKKKCKIAEEWIQSNKKLDDGKGNIVNVTKQYKQFKFEGLKNAVNE